MLSRMLSALGIGGPAADTVLDTPHTAPGQVITGQVHVSGGRSAAEVSRVALSLVTSVDADYGDRELWKVVPRRDLYLLPGQVVSIPFRLHTPWETPITAIDGVWLPGVSVSVRTELVVAGAPDQRGLGIVLVEPAPGQAKVLEAVRQRGFQLHGACAETGRLKFLPPSGYADRIGEAGLTLVAGPHELCVILDADGRGGEPLHVTHGAALTFDWFGFIGRCLDR